MADQVRASLASSQLVPDPAHGADSGCFHPTRAFPPPFPSLLQPLALLACPGPRPGCASASLLGTADGTDIPLMKREQSFGNAVGLEAAETSETSPFPFPAPAAYGRAKLGMKGDRTNLHEGHKQHSRSSKKSLYHPVPQPHGKLGSPLPLPCSRWESSPHEWKCPRVP